MYKRSAQSAPAVSLGHNIARDELGRRATVNTKDYHLAAVCVFYRTPIRRRRARGRVGPPSTAVRLTRTRPPQPPHHRRRRRLGGLSVSSNRPPHVDATQTDADARLAYHFNITYTWPGFWVPFPTTITNRDTPTAIRFRFLSLRYPSTPIGCIATEETVRPPVTRSISPWFFSLRPFLPYMTCETVVKCAAWWSAPPACRTTTAPAVAVALPLQPQPPRPCSCPSTISAAGIRRP